MVLLGALHVLLVLWVLYVARNRNHSSLLHFVGDYRAPERFAIYSLGFHIQILRGRVLTCRRFSERTSNFFAQRPRLLYVVSFTT